MKLYILAIIFSVLTVALLTPITVIGYGMLFNGYFSANQIAVAGIMGLIGVFTIIMAAVSWSEVK